MCHAIHDHIPHELYFSQAVPFVDDMYVVIVLSFAFCVMVAQCHFLLRFYILPRRSGLIKYLFRLLKCLFRLQWRKGLDWSDDEDHVCA